jgi:hypothetical protein
MRVTNEEDRWLLEKRRQDQKIDESRAAHRLKRLVIWVAGVCFCTLVVGTTRCQTERGRVETAAKVEEMRLDVEQNIEVSSSFVECLREASFAECHGVLPLPPSEDHKLEMRKIEAAELEGRMDLANQWFHKCVDERLTQSGCREYVQAALAGL